MEWINDPRLRCIHCGYCCNEAPCGYGVSLEDETRCMHLTDDNKCGVYNIIIKHEKDINEELPMFGTECCSPLNTVRLQLLINNN